MPHLSAFHLAAIALGLLLVFGVIIAILLIRVRHSHARVLYKKTFADRRHHERLLYASFGFYLSFALIRIITHLIRAGVGPFHNVEMGGRHIHHLVWGILLLLLVGYAWLWQTTHHPRTMGRILSTLYGVGAGLTLDEFALWLNLKDVYWEREGRASIEAALLFAALLNMGIFGGRFFHALVRAAFRRHPEEVPVEAPEAK